VENSMSEKKKGLVPRLRFPEFRDAGEWEKLYGAALFEQISNKEHNSDLPILAITQEYGAIPREMIDYHVSVNEKSVSSYKVVESGDFIISLRSFQGGIEYSKYKGLCSPAYVILRLQPNACGDFFRSYFKTNGFIRNLIRNLEGIRDGKMVSYKQFSEVPLPVPKLEEQQKIAACLSSLDALIAAHADKLDALKTHKKGLMQQLFPREGETVPRLRFPEFREAGEWQTTLFGKLLDIIDGDRGSNYPKAEEFIAEGFCLFLNAKNVTKDGFRFEELQFITQEKDKALRKGKLKPKDIILTTRGSVGQFAYFTENVRFENMRINSGMVILRVKTEKLIPEYVYVFSQSPYLASHIKTVAFGNAQQQLTVAGIKQFPISHPDIEEQQKIAACLSSLDALITAQADKLDALKTHKKGLMQQLFPNVSASSTESQP
jgi:type I restriction enzyme S subunit